MQAEIRTQNHSNTILRRYRWTSVFYDVIPYSVAERYHLVEGAAASNLQDACNEQEYSRLF
jgi:hypothetical protein